MMMTARAYVNTGLGAVIVDKAANGIELRKIVTKGGAVGTRVQQYRGAVASLELQRRLYDRRRADGATKIELDNIAARGRELRQYVADIEKMFYSDFREFGAYRLPRAKIVQLWSGHNDIGLYNEEVLITELNSGDKYYVQF